MTSSPWAYALGTARVGFLIAVTRNEIRVMSMSDHPNVVRYHCSFVTKSRYLWIVMPLMHGGSAMNIMQAAQQGGFEEDIIAYILLQVLQALQYFHESGLIHRDIKSSNILVDQMGNVFLGDFGVSAALSASTSSDRRELRQTFVGTPCWMAPEVMEQMSGYDQRADIWSFGVTAIELALGKAPYDGYDPLKVLLLTLKEPPPTLEGQDPLHAKFSKHIHEVVNSCLQKDPAKRPSTAELLQMPFFVKAAETKKVGLLVRILQRLPPLVERFKMIEARTKGRSGVWSVSKAELTTALANNNTAGDKISWDFETEPENDKGSELQEDDEPEPEPEESLEAIPADLLMPEVLTPDQFVSSVCVVD